MKFGDENMYSEFLNIYYELIIIIISLRNILQYLFIYIYASIGFTETIGLS